MKELIVRILLRVSSTGQLDADGDLGTQRNIVINYVKAHADLGWVFDETLPDSEYFEGANSGYKNAVKDREVLQQIAQDAKAGKFDVLVCYKDDRLGRIADEVPLYIKKLAKYGVEVYTVRDGCLTPHNSVERLFNSIRYWKAEESSTDTSQRVKDAAIEHTKQGKNVGGKAPYGYVLEFSGELSKHQRALQKKVLVPEQAAVVLLLYDLAITKGYGSQRIAKTLNSDEKLKRMAPDGEEWKTGTVGDILKNPIYTGYQAYNRRSHTGESLTRLERDEWILSEVCNQELKIMEVEYWEKAQRIREKRKHKQNKRIEEHREKDGYIPLSTSGQLPLIDVTYCACCGRKFTNGSKYNYWTTKDGERCKSRVRYYRCQSKHAATACEGIGNVRADDLESVVYTFVEEYLEQLEDNSLVVKKIMETAKAECENNKKHIKKLQKKVKDIENDIDTLKEFLPKVLRGEMLSLDLFQQQLENLENKRELVLTEIAELTDKIANEKDSEIEIDGIINNIPSWRTVFKNADYATQRMLVNRLIKRIDVSRDNVKVTVNINLDEFLSRITGGFPTIRCKHGLR